MAVTVASIAKILDDALTGIEPTLPLELSDCEDISRLISSRLPSGYGADVYHNHREIRISVRNRDRSIEINRTLRPRG